MVERCAMIAIGAALIASPATADPLDGERSPAEILEATGPEDWRPLDQENLLYIRLERGQAIVELLPTLAPAHAAQMRALVREGFYDGLSFYRVIDGFVAQGGDALETKEVETAAQTLEAEFDAPLSEAVKIDGLGDRDGYTASFGADVGFVGSHPVGYDLERAAVWGLHCAGAVAMARGEARDSAGTEFYITLQPQRYLDRNLTVFGRIVDGMSHIQRLRRNAPPQTEDDDRGETILSMRVGADLPEAEQKRLEILRSDRPLFREYAESRRNRPEAFFYFRPDYIDICQFSVPVRERTADSAP